MSEIDRQHDFGCYVLNVNLCGILIRFEECERRDKNDGKYQKTINYMCIFVFDTK